MLLLNGLNLMTETLMEDCTSEEEEEGDMGTVPFLTRCGMAAGAGAAVAELGPGLDSELRGVAGSGEAEEGPPRDLENLNLWLMPSSSSTHSGRMPTLQHEGGSGHGHVTFHVPETLVIAAARAKLLHRSIQGAATCSFAA